MSPLSLPPAAAAVLVHQWTPQNFEPTLTCEEVHRPKEKCVIWELGLLLCLSEVNEAASVEKAKVIHSWEVLDAKVGCARSVLKAKYNYQAAIQEAKMIRGNLLQKSEIAYSKAIGEAAALRSLQSVALHREHVRLMQC